MRKFIEQVKTKNKRNKHLNLSCSTDKIKQSPNINHESFS